MKNPTRPGEPEYNYSRFDPSCFAFQPFPGPKAGEPAKDHFTPEPPSPRVMLRAFRRGGWDAIWDFLAALPKLLALRLKGRI